jgi:ring-1,2-phenylacetyl-CoA epoxidase subunit PaaD
MKTLDKSAVWEILEQVCDPEIPVITIADLGVLRDVVLHEDGVVEVIITPTYSGCPAMNMIAVEIRLALKQAGIDQIKITTQLSPAWTTDWFSESGKAKLKAYGIAPPVNSSPHVHQLFGEEVVVECPQCHSKNTKVMSQFGSTSCKALYQCQDCKEPFDYFKCHR